MLCVQKMKIFVSIVCESTTYKLSLKRVVPAVALVTLENDVAGWKGLRMKFLIPHSARKFISYIL